MSKNKSIVIGTLAIVILGGYFLVKQNPIGIRGGLLVARDTLTEREIAPSDNDGQSRSKNTVTLMDAEIKVVMRGPERITAPPLKDRTYLEYATGEAASFYPTENNPSADSDSNPVALWQSNASAALLDDDRVAHTEPVRSDPEFLANLQVGQSLDFFVPQIGRSYLSTINSTSNQLGDVKVWKGNIQDENKRSNVIITQGIRMTHVILSTADGVYSAQIDNKTGDGEVVDEREFTENMSDQPDGVPFSYPLGRRPL